MNIDSFHSIFNSPAELASGDFAGDISGIEDQLTQAVAAERELSELRTRLLLDGSDSQLNDCERKLERARLTQLRTQERISLLTSKHSGGL